MSRLASKGVLVFALFCGYRPVASADELEYDLCLSPASATLSALTSETIKKRVEDAIKQMKGEYEPEAKDLLKGKSKKEKDAIYKQLDVTPKNWTIYLLGDIKVKVAQVAQDTGEWRIYRRIAADREVITPKKGQGSKVEVPQYSESKEERGKAGGLLGTLVSGVTPTQTMVCLNWDLPIQGAVEGIVAKHIVEEMLLFEKAGLHLFDEVQVRVK